MMSGNEGLRFAAPPGAEKNATASPSRREPSRWEVLLMLFMIFGLHLLAVCRVSDFWKLVVSTTDDADYVEIAKIIGHGHFSGGVLPAAVFWGFPYTIAAASKIFHMPELMAAVLISILCSSIVCYLVHRLYGGWVAAVFILMNFDWIRVSVEGGSEPLFMCLLCAAFLAARSERWKLAALLAALSTTVRPVGIFALLGLAAALATRRSYRKLAAITALGLAVGILYAGVFWRLTGDPFAGVLNYRGDWGNHHWPVNFPFAALISNFRSELQNPHGRWYTYAYGFAWPLLALAGTAAMWLPRNRKLFWTRLQPEAWFAAAYTLFFLSYNYEEILWFTARFVIPVLPLVVFSLRDGIPHDRRVLWGGAVVSALLSAAVLVHFKNLVGINLP